MYDVITWYDSDNKIILILFLFLSYLILSYLYDAEWQPKQLGDYWYKKCKSIVKVCVIYWQA